MPNAMLELAGRETRDVAGHVLTPGLGEPLITPSHGVIDKTHMFSSANSLLSGQAIRVMNDDSFLHHATFFIHFY